MKTICKNFFFFDFCKFRIEGEQKGKYVKGEFVFQISFPVDISQKKKKNINSFC